MHGALGDRRKKERGMRRGKFEEASPAVVEGVGGLGDGGSEGGSSLGSDFGDCWPELLNISATLLLKAGSDDL